MAWGPIAPTGLVNLAKRTKAAHAGRDDVCSVPSAFACSKVGALLGMGAAAGDVDDPADDDAPARASADDDVPLRKRSMNAELHARDRLPYKA